MTDDERKELASVFMRYGSPSDQMDQRFSFFYTAPTSIHGTTECEHAIQQSEEDIKALEKWIRIMRLYQQAVTERYNELLTAASKKKITLTRRREYYPKKHPVYDLEIFTHYIDADEDVLVDRKRFEGKERYTAIKAYYELVSRNPDCIHTIDIAKSKWE